MFTSLFLITTLMLAPAATDDEQQLRHLKTVRWNEAYRTQNVALLDSILHDSFEMLDDEGKRSTKKDELDWIANNRWDPGTFEYRVERLRVYGGSFAIVDGRGIATSYTYASSNAFVKEQGRWRAVLSHVSGVRKRDGTDESGGIQR